MRVAQIRTTTTSRAGKSARGGTRDGQFQLPKTQLAQPRAEVAGPPSVAGVDTIVTLQTIEEPPDRRRSAIATGDRILDILDQLKIGLLSGQVLISDLDKLKRTIERQQMLDNDPELNEILEQIDLRARVELAKLKDTAA